MGIGEPKQGDWQSMLLVNLDDQILRDALGIFWSVCLQTEREVYAWARLNYWPRYIADHCGLSRGFD